MFLQTLVLMWNTLFLQTILAALNTRPAGALLVTPTVHLYTNNYQPLPNDTVASYTEATFSGYAAAAATPVGPVNNPVPGQELVAVVDFIATTASPFVPNTIYGYFVEAGGLLVCSEKFAAPVAIASPGDSIFLALALCFGNVQLS